MYLSVVQYQIEALPNWQAYEDKMVRLIERCKENNAQCISLGEYAGLELASWTNSDLQKQFAATNDYLPEYIRIFSSLAKAYQVYIQPGTLPVKESDGTYRNRAYFFAPNSDYSYQDKLCLTPFEEETTLFSPGNELRVFETPFAKIGILIGYDAAFPTLAHQLIQAGVELLLIPSCTERLTGLTRISINARARAIENQCYTALSSLIGKASWCELIDINIGQSAIFSPADASFSENGIVAQSEINTPMLVEAVLDFQKIKQVRQLGEVHQLNDMQTILNKSISLTHENMSL